jgi:nitrate/nitrite transport system ATP-binding protein
MTNGPRARIAEIVENSLPRPRARHDLHRHPDYYPIRNHVIDFLVERSRRLAESGPPPGWDPRRPPVVRPAARPGAALASD